MERSKTALWRIWVKSYNKDGRLVGAVVLPNTYTRKDTAIRAARNRFDLQHSDRRYEWIVSQENPWIDNRDNPDFLHRLTAIIE